MERHRLLFEKFTITIFNQSAGEERFMSAGELTKGGLDGRAIQHLLDQYPDARPLHTIPVYTKGGFEAIREGLPPDPRPAGTGATQFVRGFDNYRMRALENGSEFHCITPRDSIYYQRALVKLATSEKMLTRAKEYIYLAYGSISTEDGLVISGPTMIDVTRKVMLEAKSDILGARMWL